MKEVPDSIVCEGCDAVCRRVPLRRREISHCERCGTELDRHAGGQSARVLPLTVASLILFAIANLFPIVQIELQGLTSQTTLAGAVVALSVEGMSPVALLVLATTILFPLLQLCILFYVLVPLHYERRPAGFAVLVRLLQSLRPWGMVEVFLLGVLVAIIKLGSIAQVIAGPALWAFVGLTVLLTAILSFNPRTFWELAFELPWPGQVPRPTAERRDAAAHPAAPQPVHTASELGLLSCHHCGTVWQGAAIGEPCARCSTRLHRRKPDSINRTWALLLSAAILYLPANLLPVMITRSLFGIQQDTILSGVIYFWVSGAYGLAALIFVASFLVPLFKLAALTLLNLLAQRRSDWRQLERARLYRMLEVIGRWSMLDVFVVALLAGLVRIQGFAEITAGVGIAAFGGVVVLTMLASLSFDPRLTWDTREARRRGAGADDEMKTSEEGKNA